MPKKSITFNGFGGGINEYSDPVDLKNDGTGAEEVPYNDEWMLDAPGKLTTIKPHFKEYTDYTHGYTKYENNGSNGELFVSAKNDQHILVKDSNLYRFQGIFALGEYINWSNNSNFQIDVPANGSLGSTGQVANGHNIQMTASRNQDYVIFQGANASQSNGTGMVFGRATDDDSTTVSKAPNDLFRYFGDDGDDDVNEGTTHWMDGGYVLNTTLNHKDAGDWICYTGSSVLDLSGSGSANTDFSSATEFVFHSNNTHQQTSAINFRTGTAEIDSDGDLETGGYHPLSGISINGMGCAIEVKVPTSLSAVDCIFVGADSDDGDSEFDFNGDDKGKVWKFTGTMLDEAGAGDGFVRLTLGADQNSYQGSLFNVLEVKQVWVMLAFANNMTADGNSQWGGTASYTHIDDSQMRIREVSFYKDSLVDNWGEDSYNIYQTRVEKDIESLTKVYSSKYSATPNPVLLTVHQSTTSGYKGKLYYEALDSDNNVVGDKFLMCETDATDGIRKVGEDDYVAWSSNKASILLEGPPVFSTYTLESGYPEGTEEINARWKHSAVNGRQVYIGNVQQPIDATKKITEWDNGTILKGVIGKPGGFSDKVFIDLELGEGSITCMRSVGDRLFVFTKNKLVIINVAQDNEFLEDTAEGMGVKHPGQVIEIEGSVFIVNGRGLTVFTGQKFQNLSQRIGSKFNANSSRLTYDPQRKNLFIWRHSSEMYAYNLNLNTFVYRVTNFNDSTAGSGVPTTNTLMLQRRNITNGNAPSMAGFYYSNFNSSQQRYGYLRYSGYKVIDEIDDGNSDYSATPRTINSPVIDFGNPSRRKKIYKAYVNLAETQSGGTMQIKMSYSTDRGSSWTDGYPEETGGGSAYLSLGLNTIPVSVTCKTFQFRFYANSSTHAYYEIGDISITYRDKPLR
tara:strand:+ start:126 stop:2846 length:2721 start_codon:yes stop_codon:yes gene_type:complete